MSLHGKTVTHPELVRELLIGDEDHKCDDPHCSRFLRKCPHCGGKLAVRVLLNSPTMDIVCQSDDEIVLSVRLSDEAIPIDG